MAGFSRREVYKITELRNGCVYKTQKIKSIWLPLVLSREEELRIAKEHGGDMLAATLDYHFGKECPK